MRGRHSAGPVVAAAATGRRHAADSPATQSRQRPSGRCRRWSAGASGDAKLAVRRFVHMCVEVLNGYRPPAHLRRLALPKEAAAVVAQAVAGTSRVAGSCAGRSASTPRARPATATGDRPGPVAVIRLRLCEPRPGAVEAAVLLVTGDRTWAMALRLELHQQAWCATTLTVHPALTCQRTVRHRRPPGAPAERPARRASRASARPAERGTARTPRHRVRAVAVRTSGRVWAGRHPRAGGRGPS